MGLNVKKLSRNGYEIAYYLTHGKPPYLIFCGGFNSSMQGTKALALQKYCIDKGQAYIRFDYFAHGQSEGDFAEGSVSRWLADTLAIIDHISDDVVLVGSSMGGWLAILAALQRPDRVKGLVLLACAADMTKYYPQRVEGLSLEVDKLGRKFYSVPNEYDDQQPYKIYANLIEDGEQHCLLDKPIHLTAPVYLIHGKLDDVVPWQRSEQVHALLPNARLHLVDDGDHRLSRSEDLDLLFSVVKALYVEI